MTTGDPPDQAADTCASGGPAGSHRGPPAIGSARSGGELRLARSDRRGGEQVRGAAIDHLRPRRRARAHRLEGHHVRGPADRADRPHPRRRLHRLPVELVRDAAAPARSRARREAGRRAPPMASGARSRRATVSASQPAAAGSSTRARASSASNVVLEGGRRRLARGAARAASATASTSAASGTRIRERAPRGGFHLYRRRRLVYHPRRPDRGAAPRRT